jgi:hypothetical protein
MNYSLGMVQDLYRIGTRKWIDKITNATDIEKLAEDIFNITTLYKMDWRKTPDSQAEINWIKNARKEGVLGIEILARNIIIHYLGCRYASTKEIHDWLNEELHRVNDLSFRLQ